MCPYEHFYRGNAKQTSATLKKKYRIRLAYRNRVPNLVFASGREGGGGGGGGAI